MPCGAGKTQRRGKKPVGAPRRPARSAHSSNASPAAPASGSVVTLRSFRWI